MSAHVDDLLFDDDDDDDMGGVEAMQGFVHPPATLLQPPASIVQPPASLVQPPASLVQPPASLVPPPASLVQPPASLVQPPPSLIQPPASIGITAPPIAATPIAYQPSPPTQALPDDKLRKLFQIIQTRIKDKYVPIYNEVKAQGTPLKSDMTAILEVVKKHIGEPMLMSLMQEIGGFPMNRVVGGFGDVLKTEPARFASPPLQPAPTVRTPPAEPARPSANESEKIRFARHLLSHASTCLVTTGMCQIKKCDDIKRFFKHSTACKLGRDCSHCEQLRTLVKLHAEDCSVVTQGHCPIPFCNDIRRAAANRGGPKTPVKPTSPPKTITKLQQRQAADEDDAPSKNQPAKASPPPPKMAPQAAEYGRILQLILHCKNCLVPKCPYNGCIEAKSHMLEMRNPETNVPRAQTFRQVYKHYEACKNDACPVCTMGRQQLAMDAAPSTPAGKITPRSTPTLHVPTASSPRSPNHGIAKKKTPKNPTTIARPDPTKSMYGMPSAIDTSSSSIAMHSGTEYEDLVPTNANDLRREADVLTHTNIDPTQEKRIMLAGVPKANLLASKKETWMYSDVFQSHVLQQTMQKALLQAGVHATDEASDMMGLALHEYLKQILEEMVHVSKQRCDSHALLLPSTNGAATLTAVDILKASTDDSFAKLRDLDLGLRAELLEEAKKEESTEKDKGGKRRKAKVAKTSATSAPNRSVLDGKDEEDMDVEELARKDLKAKLVLEGAVIDGRVNASISVRRPKPVENQITMEDAEYWLRSQKPYVDAKLFCRAQAARIQTKSLQ
ncbi:hypothetical protein SDRG_12865 [Saprolegnia diclina VS20]|uniref:histone acetyltransferase n=1 Tax=Saprolegnia diclina (strain VS20) TaxID=1156394 RepID=T0RHV3_SAPDV|nr:hypothetical protein SDRG_12865 [Saprolegnia diclina VS20]EQC29402.1 hypothetical protein SDRG_12865 [Saprolegnia diclina VS20]|eukprot:XP_008617169.1 hypothetical protein SDRG_12865 [Saprolegnia diclina VS20]